MQTDAAFSGTTDRPFDEAVEACRQALAAEGFGVLTEIDVQATLKKKLDVDRSPYVILGACHPPSAHRALELRPDIGVMLPCNVTVSVEDDRTVVRAMNPAAALQMFDEPGIREVAADVGAALERVVGAVC
jgi:uncharacterized protein (DUF302 family)